MGVVDKRCVMDVVDKRCVMDVVDMRCVMDVVDMKSVMNVVDMRSVVTVHPKGMEDKISLLSMTADRATRDNPTIPTAATAIRIE